MLNFDEILLELSYRINSGVIDLNKEEQIKMLHQILTENNIESPTEIVNKAKIYFSLLNEANAYKAVSKESGKIVQFTNKDNYQDALKAGTHADVNSKQGKEILKKGGEKNKPSKGTSVFGTDGRAKVFPDKNTAKPTKKAKNINDKIRKENNFNKSKNMSVGLDDNTSQKKIKANKVKKINNNPVFRKNDIDTIFDGQTKFPKKYLKVIDRLMQHAPDNATITMFTDKAGAGTLASTAGEIIGMVGLSIQDPNKTKAFFDKLRERVKENHGKGIVDESWVNSSEAHCMASERKLKRDFPNGYTILNTFWDVSDEAEAIGVENYKENKGFSTDVNMLVKDNKTGKTIWLEPSLKKSEKVNLLNGTTNRVKSIAVLASKKVSNAEKDEYEMMTKELESMGEVKKGNTPEWKRKEELINKVSELESRVESEVPAEANPTLAYETQTKLHQKVYSDKNSLTQVRNVLTTFNKLTPKQKVEAADSILKEMGQSSKPALVKEVINTLSTLAKNKDQISNLKSVGEIIKDTSRGTQKASMFLLNYAQTINKGDTLIKAKKSIDNNSNKHSKAVADYLLSTDETKAGLLRSIREAFPVKSLLEGEENMLLGDTKKGKAPGTNIDQYVLQRVFGVKSAEEFQSGLKVYDTPPPPHISFLGKGKNTKPIEIATIKSRSDGKGYGGTWKLEMSLSDAFVDLCKKYDT